VEAEHWAHICDRDEKNRLLTPKVTVECKIIIGNGNEAKPGCLIHLEWAPQPRGFDEKKKKKEMGVGAVSSTTVSS
jgi:hypothetical protein